MLLHIFLRRTPQGTPLPQIHLEVGVQKKSKQKKRGWLYTTFSDYGARACRVTPASIRKDKKKEEKQPWDPIPKP